MTLYNSVYNGMGCTKGETKANYLNAHFSYKGRSVIIDYEFCLHGYSHLKPQTCEEMTAVPFEIYPYGDDIHWDFVECDAKFHKADMGKLLALIDKALEDEPKHYENDEF